MQSQKRSTERKVDLESDISVKQETDDGQIFDSVSPLKSENSLEKNDQSQKDARSEKSEYLSAKSEPDNDIS
jgi:hypothetical protein